MSEPRRWKDSPDAPVGMRELLGAARPSRPLDEATFKRGAGRLSPASVAPAAIAAVSIWSKLAAAGAIGLVAVGAVVAVDAQHRGATRAAMPAALPAPPPQVVPAAPAEAPVVAPVDETPEPVGVAAASAAPSSPRLAAPSKDVRRAQDEVASAAAVAPEVIPEFVPEAARAKSSLAEELALLEEARVAMAGSPETALTPLEKHRARHPYGVLADERELMVIDVLRRIGRTHDARSRAHAWLARDPNGMLTPRVRAILATLE